MDNHGAGGNDSMAAGERNGTLTDTPPRFKEVLPLSEVRPAGNSLRLRCPAVGNPTPNITWLKNGEEPTRTLGQPSYNKWGKWGLRLEDTVMQDGGNYTCSVCNYLGCISHTFKVNIIGECPYCNSNCCLS